MTDDATLLAGFRRGDEAAFALLAERYHHAIHAACQRQAPADEVDDCVQAVFLVLARRPVAAGRAPVLLAWLHRVAHFVCRDARRSAARRRRTTIASNHPPTTGHHPEAVVLEQLDGALLRLEERQRAAVLLHASGSANDDIAERLGVTVANASKLVQRGLAALRERLCRAGKPVGAAALLGLLSTTSASAASTIPLTITALSGVGPHAGLLAKGTLMHLTILTAKPWIIAATIAASIGIGGIIAAEALSPATIPPVTPLAAEAAAEPDGPGIMQRRVTLNLQDRELTEVIKLLRDISNLDFILDPAVTAANPKISVQVENMKLQDVLGVVTKAAELRYEERNGAIFIEPAPVQVDAPPQAAAPTVTLKVRDMTTGNALAFISALTATPLKIDPRLADRPITFELRDTPLTDGLHFLAEAVGGEVQPLPGGQPGYQIVPKTQPDADPVVPSAAQ